MKTIMKLLVLSALLAVGYSANETCDMQARDPAGAADQDCGGDLSASACTDDAGVAAACTCVNNATAAAGAACVADVCDAVTGNQASFTGDKVQGCTYVCSGNFTVEPACTTCPNTHVQDSACDKLLSNVCDVASGNQASVSGSKDTACTYVCSGNFTVAPACTTCPNTYVQDDDCDKLVANACDVASGNQASVSGSKDTACTYVCSGNFTVAPACTTCPNTYVQDSACDKLVSNVCDVASGNQASVSGSKDTACTYVCSGNFTVAPACTTCPSTHVQDSACDKMICADNTTCQTNVGTTGTCVATKVAADTNTACDDGDAKTGTDGTCDGLGACTGATALPCAAIADVPHTTKVEGQQVAGCVYTCATDWTGDLCDTWNGDACHTVTSATCVANDSGPTAYICDRGDEGKPTTAAMGHGSTGKMIITNTDGKVDSCAATLPTAKWCDLESATVVKCKSLWKAGAAAVVTASCTEAADATVVGDACNVRVGVACDADVKAASLATCKLNTVAVTATCTGFLWTTELCTAEASANTFAAAVPAVLAGSQCVYVPVSGKAADMNAVALAADAADKCAPTDGSVVTADVDACTALIATKAACEVSTVVAQECTDHMEKTAASGAQKCTWTAKDTEVAAAATPTNDPAAKPSGTKEEEESPAAALTVGAAFAALAFML